MLTSPDGMCELPFDVSDDETIVRAIKTPYHLNKKGTALRRAAFRSPAGTDDLSVMRLDYLGADRCKEKAVEIAVDSYVGLAAIRASAIRAAGSGVFDSRSEFWGHAHISHGIIVPANEPLSAEENIQLDERLDQLVERSRYYPDPSPRTPTWNGPPLVPPSA